MRKLKSISKELAAAERKLLAMLARIYSIMDSRIENLMNEITNKIT